VHYQFNAVKTIKTSFQGTLNMLGLAKRTKARFLLTSTSGKRIISLRQSAFPLWTRILSHLFDLPPLIAIIASSAADSPCQRFTAIPRCTRNPKTSKLPLYHRTA